MGTDNDTLEKQIEEQAQLIELLRNAMLKASTQLNERNKLIETLENDKRQAEAAYLELSKKNGWLRAENESRTKQLRKIAQQLQQAMLKQETLKVELAAAQEQNALSSGNVACDVQELQMSIEALKTKNATLEAELIERQQTSEMSAAQDATAKELDELRKQNQSMQKRTNDLEQHNAEIQEKYQSAMEKLNSVQAALKKSVAENAQLHKELDEAEKLNTSDSTRRQERDRLKERLNSAIYELDAKKHEIVTLMDELQDTKTDRKILQEKLTVLQQESEEHQKDLCEMKKQLKTLDNVQKDELVSSYEKCRKENESLREQLREQAKTLKSSTKQLLALRAKMGLSSISGNDKEEN